MEFVNQTVIGGRELAALARGGRRSGRKGPRIGIRLMGGAAIGLNLLFAWASWRGGGAQWWVNGAVALFLLVILLFEDRINAKINTKYILPEAREVTAAFGPEGYTSTSQASDSRFRYEQIQAVCETKDYFLFYLDRNLGQVYAKSGFTKGTPMAFRDFISRKTGLAVRNIR